MQVGRPVPSSSVMVLNMDEVSRCGGATEHTTLSCHGVATGVARHDGGYYDDL